MTDKKRKAAPVDYGDQAKIDGNNSFPVIGVGASAGGLAAIEEMLSRISTDVPMAFVIIQHLDPTYQDSLVSILQKSTNLPVIQITQRQAIKPGHIYVLPHNHGVQIHNGLLILTELVKYNGLHLPIDAFFETLAKEKGKHSIGIILSGMGSDGTKGFHAIKSAGGLTLVQTPETAKFTSMPQSAISAGLVDAALPPENIIPEIAKILSNPIEDFRKTLKHSEGMIPIESLETVTTILRKQTGYDFSDYKSNTLTRRIRRRMELHRSPNISAYESYLRENPSEAHLLFKEILIGVTAFFRDPETWQTLITKIIPALLNTKPAGGDFRAWIAACSTGEEAYSLAIAFCESAQQIKSGVRYELKIYATDIDEDAIDFCRKGIYSKDSVKNIPTERLNRYFQSCPSGYKVTQTIRDMIVFAPQNVIVDYSFAKMDIISCRNFLIYLNNTLQSKILKIFHFSLNPYGILVLGISETVGELREFFTPIAGKLQIYRKNKPDVTPSQLVLEATGKQIRQVESRLYSFKKNPEKLEAALGQHLLSHFSDPALLTNEHGDIIYIHGKTGDYLDPAVGKVNMNVFAMARDQLSGVLATTFACAVKEGRKSTAQGIVLGEKNRIFQINLTIEPLSSPTLLSGLVLIVFKPYLREESEAPKSFSDAQNVEHKSDESNLTLKHLLVQRESETLAIRAEMQRSQQELRSFIEELQSTNEELQATNEELTTSKEEMQSMNEELQTVNQELMAKVEELSQASDDMVNLLNNAEIATIFLDDALCVRRFTEEARNIIRLREGDAGRPISDLATNLDYPAMLGDIFDVLHESKLRQREVQGHDGEWFDVCIKPYHTAGQKFNGIVLTFVNITKLKNVQAALEIKEKAFNENVAHIPLVIANIELNLRYSWVFTPKNEYKKIFVIGKNDLEIFGGKKEAHELESLKKKCINEKKFTHTMISLVINGQTQNFDITLNPILDTENRVIGATMIAIATREFGIIETEERY